MASIAAAAISTAAGSIVDQSGTSSRIPPTCCSTTLPNSVCSANQIDKLRMTPTTAAVIVESAALSAARPRKYSMYGAPRKIQRKQGAKVTQTVTTEPATPAQMGESGPGSRYAPKKPTNCRTMISGPGVVSAMQI